MSRTSAHCTAPNSSSVIPAAIAYFLPPGISKDITPGQTDFMINLHRV